ncbi:unnamed protein product [Durusdinium trenchii]|uniref:Uncharacterized protein n=1 Tax=Durusdinium trenchii TaxID=1381693 RepID=A0ABP0Q1P8_9DINO
MEQTTGKETHLVASKPSRQARPLGAHFTNCSVKTVRSLLVRQRKQDDSVESCSSPGRMIFCGTTTSTQPALLPDTKVPAGLKVCPQENAERQVGSKVCFLPRMAGGRPPLPRQQI